MRKKTLIAIVILLFAVPCMAQEAHLWCINSDGTGLRKLADFVSWCPNVWMPPVFSPDGSQIVFTKEYASEHRSELWRVNVDGTGLVQLTDPGPQMYGHEWPMDWSPDGSSISFRSERSNHNGWFEVWTMNADGSSQQNFGESNGLEASFSPDGSKIAYGKWYEGHLKVMNNDGSNKHTIHQCQRSHAPRHIQWARTNQIIFEDSPVLDNEDIYSINPDGTGLLSLAALSGNDRINNDQLVVSPDGSKLVFYSDNRGNYDVYIVNTDGTNLQQLTADPGDDTEPLFSPDGSQIVWISESSGPKCIWIMNADGTGKQRLTDSTGNVYEIAVAPIEKGTFKIAFYSSRVPDDIPTLTEWGLIIFGVVLIGFITYVFLRRRKAVVSLR